MKTIALPLPQAVRTLHSSHKYMLLSVVLFVTAVSLFIAQLGHTPLVPAVSGHSPSLEDMLRVGAFFATLVGGVLTLAWSFEEGLFSSMDD